MGKFKKLDLDNIEIDEPNEVKQDEIKPNEVQEVEQDEKKGAVFKARNFHIVIQNSNLKHIKKYIQYLTYFDQFNYILVCTHKLEKNKNGVEKPEHAHIYVQYTNAETIDSKKLDFGHIGKCYGSAQANIKYLKCQDNSDRHKHCKSETLYRLGVPKYKGGLSALDIEGFTPEEIREFLPFRYWRIAMEILEAKEKRDMALNWIKNVKSHSEMSIEWHIGKGGVGKTYIAAEEGEKIYNETKIVPIIVDMTKDGAFTNFMGDERSNTLILNEFRHSDVSFTDFLKILTNEKIHNVKHGQMYFKNVKKIIVTTQQSPLEIYTNVAEDRNQIYRRITKVITHYKDNEEFKAIEQSMEEFKHGIVF